MEDEDEMGGGQMPESREVYSVCGGGGEEVQELL